MSTHGEHERVIELIPWFVNDTLAGPECELVERHVGECLVCRSAVREQRKIQELVGDLPTVPLSRDAALDGFLNRVDRSRRGSGRAQRLALALAASAVICAVLVWTIVIDSDTPQSGNDFSTLAIEAPPVASIDVIFADGISDAQKDDILDSVDGTVVSGPTEIGRYTIAVDEPSDVATALDTLRNDSRIRLAAPAFIDGDSQ